jgi:hypothetical protein
MFNHDVLPDAFHGVKCLLFALADKVYLAESAMTYDDQQFKVLERRVDKSVTAPKSTGTCHAELFGELVKAKV